MIKRLQGSFLIAVFFSLFLLAGCYHATIDTGLAPGSKTVEMWKHSWIAGLVPPSVVEAQSECENGVARVETQHSFVNGLVGILTYGIYTPVTVIVTCAATDMSSAAVDSASVVTVPYGSDDEEVMDAFGQAADKAVAADQLAYVQFADQAQAFKKMSLHDAAEEGILDGVRFLVENGADVNAHDERESTPLHVAAKRDHLEVVRFLVGSGADVNARDILDVTPLDEAARDGHLEVVRFLVENEADDLNGALIWAAGVGHLEVVRFLVENGADYLNGALRYAGGGHLEVVRFLVGSGADVNARDKFGNTPLHFVAAPISSFREGHLEVVRFLVGNGADVNARNKKDKTPLHGAARSGHLEAVRFLVGNGADVNARKEDGETPLHRTVFSDHLEVVRFLVGNGADVNARDKGDRTPLHTAARNAHLEVVRFLVENGADVNARDPDRRTPLRVATDEEVANYLRSQGGTK